MFQHFSLYVPELECFSRKRATMELCNWKNLTSPHTAADTLHVGRISVALVTSSACAMAWPVPDPPRQDKQSDPELKQEKCIKKATWKMEEVYISPVLSRSPVSSSAGNKKSGKRGTRCQQPLSLQCCLWWCAGDTEHIHNLPRSWHSARGWSILLLMMYFISSDADQFQMSFCPFPTFTEMQQVLLYGVWLDCSACVK